MVFKMKFSDFNTEFSFLVSDGVKTTYYKQLEGMNKTAMLCLKPMLCFYKLLVPKNKISAPN